MTYLLTKFKLEQPINKFTSLNECVHLHSLLIVQPSAKFKSHRTISLVFVFLSTFVTFLESNLSINNLILPSNRTEVNRIRFFSFFSDLRCSNITAAFTAFYFAQKLTSLHYLTKILNLPLKSFAKKLFYLRVLCATNLSRTIGVPCNASKRVETSFNLNAYQTLNDYFFSPNFSFNVNKNSRWLSMEEIINHFIFYSEGPSLPAGFAQGSVEAPKGHLGVSVFSNGGNKPLRSRIRSSILVMASHLNNLVQGVGLGDFVVIVSASNIVVGEIDR